MNSETYRIKPQPPSPFRHRMSALAMAALCALLLLTACNMEDTDSYNLQPPLGYRGEMGTLLKQKETYHIAFDNGQVRTLADSSLLDKRGLHTPGIRVIALYNMWTDVEHTVFYDIQAVLTKSFLFRPSQAQSDSIGHDPMEVSLAWLSGNYLNIAYRVYGVGGKRPHLITAVWTDETTENGYAIIEIRHNYNGNNSSNRPDNLAETAYASFCLPTGTDGTESYAVRFTDWGGHTQTLAVTGSNAFSH